MLNTSLKFLGCSGHAQEDAPCLTFHMVSGEEKIPSEQPFLVRKVSQLDSRRPVLVDTCGGRNRVKQVSPECRFFIPRNPTESSVVKANLNNLVNKKIYVLEPDPIKTKEAIKQEMLKSFYKEDGKTLINEKFGSLDYPFIRPHNMVEAGFEFFGNAQEDLVKCLNGHRLGGWERNDNPINEHFYHYGVQTCFTGENIERKNYPLLYSERGGNVTGGKYKLVMPQLNRGLHGSTCVSKAHVLTHKNHPIATITFPELLRQLDSVKLEQTKQAIEKTKQTVDSSQQKLINLSNQALFLEHFSGLVRQFEEAKAAYITALEQYKATHANRDHIEINGVLASLNTNTVRDEIDGVISTITQYELPLINFKDLDPTVYNGMKEIVSNKIKSVADSYNGSHFRDKTLNMNSNQSLALEGSNYYFDPVLQSLFCGIDSKRIDLEQTFNAISDKIIKLLGDFIRKHVSPSA